MKLFYSLLENWAQFNQLICNGTTKYKLKQKLTSMKVALKQLNGMHFQHINERETRARHQLESVQLEGLVSGIMDDIYRSL